LLWQVKDGAVMMREQTIIHYRAAISIFIEWFDQGIITEEDLAKIEKIIAEKYDLPLGSIYRCKTCY
jgi:hypothetical protein